MPVVACSIEDCAARHYARGYCNKHYNRELRAGTLPARELMKDKSCELCDRPAKIYGICNGHYQRLKRGAPLLSPWREDRPKRTCIIDDCDRPHCARGLCRLHHFRRLAGTALDYAPPERTRSHAGYVLLLIERGQPRVFEHRAVMERIIGRALRDDENVHHINGQRDDNRPANLELWSTWQPCGQRVEDKVAWAKELLALYAPASLIEGADLAGL